MRAYLPACRPLCGLVEYRCVRVFGHYHETNTKSDIQRFVQAPSGKGPSQGRIAQKGNSFLDTDFPKLSHLLSAEIVEVRPVVLVLACVCIANGCLRGS